MQQNKFFYCSVILFYFTLSHICWHLGRFL